MFAKLRLSLFFKALTDLLNNALYYSDEKANFFHKDIKLIRDKRFNYLYRKCRTNGVELMFYSSENDKLYLKTKDNIYIETDSNYSVFIEVFIEKIYSLPLLFLQKEFYIFDIGMNRGYASLYFANMKNCLGVYGFEILEETYNNALRNFVYNKKLAEKITAYNLGLLDKDDEVELYCVNGHDHVASTELHYIKNQSSAEKIKKHKFNKTKVHVKKSSVVLKNILESLDDSSCKIIKIDVEGAEYEIFKDLKEGNVINEFDLIIGECHKNIDDLEKYLDDFIRLNLGHDKNSYIAFAYLHKKHKNLL